MCSGLSPKVSRTEDTILAKLRWSKLSGGSEKAFIDALRVFGVQAHTLDPAYLVEWVEALGVTELWRRLETEAELP